MSRRSRFVVLALAPLAVGCKGSRAPGAAASEAVAPAKPAAPQAKAAIGPAVCHVRITGSETASWTGHAPPPGDLNPDREGFAASDYWLNDSDIRDLLGALAMTSSAEEKRRKIDEGMKKDPRSSILLFDCKGPLGDLLLSSSDSSKYKDIPMAPGTYKISSFPGEDHTEPGHFVFMGLAAGGIIYAATGGTLKLDKFDTTGVKGSYAIDARDRHGDRAIHVTGTFDYPCADHHLRPCKK